MKDGWGAARLLTAKLRLLLADVERQTWAKIGLQVAIARRSGILSLRGKISGLLLDIRPLLLQSLLSLLMFLLLLTGRSFLLAPAGRFRGADTTVVSLISFSFGGC